MSADNYGISQEYLDKLAKDYEIEQKSYSELRAGSTTDRPLHEVEKVQVVASEIIQQLGVFVKQWELCGGARRGRQMVHDGDLVVWLTSEVNEKMQTFQSRLVEILKDQVQEGSVKFIEEVLGQRSDDDEDDDEGASKKKKKRKGGRKAKKPKQPRKIFRFRCCGVPMEINVAKSEQQFEVLKLIRTGSHEFNKNLLLKAQEQGMTIKFSHDEKLGKDLYGLYGAIQSWQADDRGRRRSVWVVNFARHVAWRENDIIEKVLGYPVEPKDREVEAVG